MRKESLQEGGILLVPLLSGFNAVGLIIRRDPDGDGILSAYFDRTLAAPSLDEAINIVRECAVVDYARCGIYALVNGEWPYLGSLPEFSRDGWSVPLFREYSGRVNERDPDDFTRVIRSFRPTSDVVSYKDSTYGAKALEIHLDRLLGRL